MKRLIYLFVAFAFCSCIFAPGSYQYAEVYKFDASEEELIKAVEKFKSENPSYNVPANFQLIDGRGANKEDFWFHIWFYYPDKNQIVYTWIRGNNSKSSFALVSINEGIQLGNWKRINKDLPRQENKNQKERFERLILNKVKGNIEY